MFLIDLLIKEEIVIEMFKIYNEMIMKILYMKIFVMYKK